MRAIASCFVFLTLTASAFAQQQNVVVDPVPLGLGPSETFTLEARYWSSGPATPDLTGLGLRLHWGSGKLTLVGLSDVLPYALAAQGDTEVDTQNHDGDGGTNRFLHLAWADLLGEWPGGTLPRVLFRATFTTAPTYNGSAAVSLSASATAAGYTFGPSLLFADDFESGDTSAWTATVGALAAAPPSGISGALAGTSDGAGLFELLVGLAKPAATATRLTALPLDIDGDGSATAATDGTLVLRYLFGFRGAALITGALGPGATRNTAAEITAFLDELSPLLDIDLDGRRDALSDGLLLARYLDGTRGAELVAGAVSPDALRATAADITTYLDVVSDPDPDGDTDGDGLGNFEEATGYEILLDLAGLGLADPGWLESLTHRWVTSDPFLSDTDADGLSDFAERTYRTDPRRADSDADGLADRTELESYGSVPTAVDSDGDCRGPQGTWLPNPLFFDGNELAHYGTSPALADTDGDARSDFAEANQNGAPPLVANVPRLAIEQVGQLDLELIYSQTSGQSELKAQSQLTGVSDTTGLSRSDSTTSAWSIGGSTTVTAGAEAEAGLPPSATVSVEASVTVSGEYSEESSASFTEESSTSTQNEFQESQETAISQERTVTGGNLGIGFVIRNLGDVAFTLRNLVVTALLSDPTDRSRFRPIASLFPPVPEEGITLGPFNGETGVLRVGLSEGGDAGGVGSLSVGLVESLMRDPSGLHFDVGTFDLLDENGRNFAFLAEVTQARTALLTIDFGNGSVERYRVATLVERNPDGTAVGVRLADVLGNVLGIDFETEPRAGSTDPLFPNGVRSLKRVRSTASQVNPASFQNSYWAVLSSDPALTGAAGLPFNTNFEDIRLKSGDTLSLAYVSDRDKDGLFATEEFLYGTPDRPIDFDLDGDVDAADLARSRDFDQDGLSDFFEVRTGWSVSVDGRPTYAVHPDPTRPDADGDGLGDATERTRGTDPYKKDTDRDGLPDGDDGNPLNNFNPGPVVNLSFNLNKSNELRVSGSISDPLDGISSLVIRWGDGTSSTFGAGTDFGHFSTRHDYTSTGSVEVVVTATDNRQPPGTASTVVTHSYSLGPTIDLAYNLDAGQVLRVSGSVSDADGISSLVINWDDGTSSTFGAGTNFGSFATTHPYLFIGSYTVRVTVTDAGAPTGGVGERSHSFTIPFPNNGRLAYYLYTNGSLADSSGNNHTAVPYLSVALSPDRHDASNSSICFHSCGGLSTPTLLLSGSFTLTAWVVPDSGRSGHIAGEPGFAQLVLNSDGKVGFTLSDRGDLGVLDFDPAITVTDPNPPPPRGAGSSAECAATVPIDVWTFYAVTVESTGTTTRVKLYRGSNTATTAQVSVVAGPVTVEAGVLTGDGTYVANSSTLWQVGGQQLGPCNPDSNISGIYGGRIDDVRAYNRVLGPAELNALLHE